jgi:hypothetical protein
MTVVARLSTIAEAFNGLQALRQRAIMPDLSNDGKHLLLCVDDDCAPNAKAILSECGKFSNEHLVQEGIGASRAGAMNFDAENT